MTPPRGTLTPSNFTGLSYYSKCQDVYQACRGWTIAVYEHIVNNDFGIRLLGTAVLSTYEADGDLGKIIRAACSVETTKIER